MEKKEKVEGQVVVSCVYLFGGQSSSCSSARRRGERVATRVNGFELVNVELLVDESNLEVDAIRRREIDADLVDVEPQEETLHLDSLEVGDGTVAQLSRNGFVVVDEVIELDVAGLIQNDDESAVVFGEGVVGDGVR